MLRPLRDLATFLTLLPLHTDGDSLHRASRSTHLLPLIGWMTGTAAALALLLLLPISPLTAAVAALTTSILFSRALHLDGLMDTADGLLCHGNPDRKLAAMKDPGTGAGGIAAALAIYGLSAAALAATSHPALLILTAEIGTKLGLTTALTTSRPLGNGLGAKFTSATRKRHLIPATILTAPALALSLITQTPTLTLAAILLAPLPAAIGLTLLSDRHLGGSNGDVIGATNEVGRAAAILTGAWLL